MNNPFLAFMDFVVALRALRMKRDLEYPEPSYPPQSAYKLFDREVDALSTIARENGIKGGSIKKFKKPIRLQKGWTNYVLTIKERVVPPSAELDLAPDIGPFTFDFLFEEGFLGVPQNQFQRIALRYGIGFLLRYDFPCERCEGRGHWVSNTRGRTRYGIGINLLGDPSKTCFRCLGYRVDPEFWDKLQARFGEFYDDPIWPLPSAANNEFFEHIPGHSSTGYKKNER